MSTAVGQVHWELEVLGDCTSVAYHDICHWILGCFASDTYASGPHGELAGKGEPWSHLTMG